MSEPKWLLSSAEGETVLYLYLYLYLSCLCARAVRWKCLPSPPTHTRADKCLAHCRPRTSLITHSK